ncbi:hypothetical protein FI667_g15456, partial [Globisporangium splendens]
MAFLFHGPHSRAENTTQRHIGLFNQLLLSPVSNLPPRKHQNRNQSLRVGFSTHPASISYTAIPSSTLSESMELPGTCQNDHRLRSRRLETQIPLPRRGGMPRSPSSPIAQVPSSLSCFVDKPDQHWRGTSPRMKIAYDDEALCLRSSANAYRLFEAALSHPTDGTSGNARLLARKALNYRNLLARAQQVDLQDPTFDVADFYGITWCERCTDDDPAFQAK